MSIKHQTSHGVISISNGMLGKMLGMQAISSSPLKNKGCLKNCTIKGSICEPCYSMISNKIYPNLRNMLIENSNTLMNAVIDIDELPTIYHTCFRFESHGDINTVAQLINYINIAKKNPKVTFSLWSKQYKLCESVFSSFPKPKNFIMIYSSLMINVELKLKNFNYADKIFTVYDKEFIADNNVKINCGAKSCLTCQTCYKKRSARYLKEVKK